MYTNTPSPFLSSLAVSNFLKATACDCRFQNPPVVDLSAVGGQALVLGKNCSVELISVTSSGFNFTFIADNFLPIAVDIGWYACPSALFGPNEGLPRTS